MDIRQNVVDIPNFNAAPGGNGSSNAFKFVFRIFKLPRERLDLLFQSRGLIHRSVVVLDSMSIFTSALSSRVDEFSSAVSGAVPLTCVVLPGAAIR